MSKSQLHLIKTSRLVKILSALIIVPITVGSLAAIIISNSLASATEESDEIKQYIVEFYGADYTDDNEHITSARLDLLSTVSTPHIELIRTYENLPIAVFAADSTGLKYLQTNPNIKAVYENRLFKNMDAPSPITAIDSNPAGFSTDGILNFDGEGYAIVIIDSGVNKNHSFLENKVIAEACFSDSGEYTDATVSSICPGGATSSTAVNSALPCSVDSSCNHGTLVAGAAVADPYSLTVDSDTLIMRGVASGAKIVSVKVGVSATEKLGQPDICDDGPTLSSCHLMLDSTVFAALDYLLSPSTTFSLPIAAVNLSLGSEPFAQTLTQCTSPSNTAYSNIINNLKTKNIATIAATGNAGTDPSLYNKISSPACLQNAIAVSATNVLGTTIASYANNGPLTDLLAPGGDALGGTESSLLWLPSATNNNAVESTQGTSFAAPMAAGAYAVIREKHPNATVDQITTLLKQTGLPITDTRTGYTVGAKPLIQLNAALAATSYPTITDLTAPTGPLPFNTPFTLTATITNATSCALNNGVGSFSVSPIHALSIELPARSSYTLTCKNAMSDTTSKTFSILVTGEPEGPGEPGGPGGPGRPSEPSEPDVPNTGDHTLLEKLSSSLSITTIPVALLIMVFIHRKFAKAKKRIRL